MPPPFLRRNKSKDGLLVSFDKTFDVIPNGHKDFLTKPALLKINEWRRRKDHDNNNVDKPLLEENIILPEEVRVDYNYYFDGDNPFPGENISMENPNPQIGAEEEAAAMILSSMSQKKKRRNYENENDEKEENDEYRNNYRTIDDWINDFNQIGNNNNMNQEKEEGDDKSYWPSFNGKSSKDLFKTALPEVPTVFGDTSDGNIMTMRLKARKGYEINVRKGDTIYIRKDKSSDLFSTALEVVEIIYGEKTYINLLVDGAENNDETTTETKKDCRKRNSNHSSSSSTTAYVRVIKPKI